VLRIKQATTAEDIAAARALLREYQALLGIDLSFQDFDAEMRDLPGDYAPPRGRLLLAMHDRAPVGCVALRDAGGPRCEMKRLFVQAGARGLGVGNALVSQIIDEARAIGYSEIVLDTLPSMADAQRLYRQLGFHDIAPYCANPIQGTRYLAKVLDNPS
jgi:ribosomal protein S18 acetylase RimI-like enzyme